MFYSDQRHTLRQQFFITWQRFRKQEIIVEPLEQQILQVMLDHPEFHPIFDNPAKYLDKDYSFEGNETNPFLHLSLHLTLRDQIATDRPQGIKAIYQQLLVRYQGDRIATEHAILPLLVQTLWQAQQSQQPFNEQQFLTCLQQLLCK
ncbi:MAG: DUF1841 family protein [Gammaproteobacteria bacterium]